MDLQKQYPLGVQIKGQFKGIPFQATVIGYQPALPDQRACLNIDVVNPHPDLPVHRIAIYSNALDYQIYDNSLCIDPIDSDVIPLAEMIIWQQWDNAIRRAVRANLKERSTSPSEATIENQLSPAWVIEIRSGEKTMRVKTGWRQAIKACR